MEPLNKELGREVHQDPQLTTCLQTQNLTEGLGLCISPQVILVENKIFEPYTQRSLRAFLSHIASF